MNQQSIENFIFVCNNSSNEAYQQFKDLLNQLDNVTTRKKAYTFLIKLKQYCTDNQVTDSNFQFLKQNILDQNDDSISLDLLQLDKRFK